MSSFELLSARARYYVLGVAVTGGATLITALYGLSSTPLDIRWPVLVGLTILTSSITVKVPSTAATLSVSEAFVFSSVILFGWQAGAVVAALDGLVISHWLQRRRKQPAYRVLFNATAPPLATAIAAWVYGIAGAPPVDAPDFHVAHILIPLCAFAITYFLANTVLLAFAIALEQHLPAVGVWRNNFMWLWLNFFSGASIAALIVSFGGKDGVSALAAIWVVLPLLGISYFTYKTSTQRIEDANRHVDQLNTLYLSTIETLAMAIDAKDQITHGHIRRVQTYAVLLAQAIGVKDEQQLRAIAAASLLHDMGKLAVPEYILNKPGALTPAEFERMKLHAPVGADILSAIDFPYPVVPIVRHHHENWDGGGYPSGLRGADIPIGARILSVVDCFDALTSDRPYRPRLSDEEALQIVRERRGTMYDPLVVDAFLDMYRQLKADADSGETDNDGKGLQLTRQEIPLPRLAAISASAGESRAMYRLIQRLAGQGSFAGAIADVVNEISTLIPATVVAFYSPAGDGELEVTQVAGSHTDWLRGRRVRLGEKIVGWSGSSGRSVLNADAQGEFGELARTATFPLKSCLTIPVVIQSEKLGVVAAFSAAPSGFTEEDQRIVEAVIRHVAPVLERLRPQSVSDAELELPTPDSPELTPVGMISCRCTAVSAAGTESIGIALAVIRRHLGAHALTQIIHANDIFVGIGISGISQIESLANGVRLTLATADLIQTHKHVAFATVPKDGTSLEHLLYACRQKLASNEERAPRVH